MVYFSCRFFVVYDDGAFGGWCKCNGGDRGYCRVHVWLFLIDIDYSIGQVNEYGEAFVACCTGEV